MRKLLVLALVLGIVGVAAANDLGNQAPVKSPGIYPENIPNPERQGGDTIALATVIPSLPYNDTGTTVGYVDNYQPTCFGANGAPDVVYSYTAAATGLTTISLCGSTYDTGLYVYTTAMVEIACNDDFCGLQSELGVVLNAGATYYIIVDGYSSASGNYTLNMSVYEPCVLACPAGGYPEGEPPLVPDYTDNYNGGCNTPGFPFQTLALSQNILCGVSGWYTFQGSQYRDTDWYILNTGPMGLIEITADAEYATYIFELSPQDCANVGVAQQATAGPCAEAFMTIPGPPNTSVWFWAGPTVFAPPGTDTMYDYVVWFDYGVIATEGATWGTLKALYE